MNPKKLKEKDRRRARKLAEEAWEAANDGNLDLAEKIIRRAVAAQMDNPVLWNDQGMLLNLRGNQAEASESFRSAISLAPSFAEPYANLAALRARQGFTREAVALQTQAVNHAPDNPKYAEQLEAYQALSDQGRPLPTTPRLESTSMEASDNDWPEKMAQFDWLKVEERLTADGCVLIPNLIEESSCEQLRSLFDDEVRFAKTVVMDRPEFGLGVYKYFKGRIPVLVDQLRRAVYPYVARVANRWRELLGELDRYPDEWESFRVRCAEAGQTTPTPILLKYGPGGFNALHRDLRGAVYFPIQMAVVLSTQDESGERGFRGGKFLFCDVPEGKKAKRRELAAGLGDAVLFCTRDRLVPVGGAYGLQPVKHGLSTIEAGERFVLGVPFHEYR